MYFTVLNTINIANGLPKFVAGTTTKMCLSIWP